MLLMTHLFGCLWIFVGNTFGDDDINGDTWIEDQNLLDAGMVEVYFSAVYFVMQTLTTVGYGDIFGVSISEKIMCIFIQFLGIIFFSFASGSLTNMIAENDKSNEMNREKNTILNKLLQEYKLPSDLYILLQSQIHFESESKMLLDTKKLIDSLPYKLRMQTNMYLYYKQYMQNKYLSEQPENFLGWICPLLKPSYSPVDDYIYYETDVIEDIFFLTVGRAGFVLPLH